MRLPTHPGSRSAPLYARVLGSGATSLDPPVTALHIDTHCARAHGRMDVQRGTSVAARLCCALLPLPTAGYDIPVTLEIGRHGNAERWWRRFGDDALVITTQQFAGDGALVERHGCFELRFAVSPRSGGLQWRSTAVRLRIGPVAVAFPTRVLHLARGGIAHRPRGDPGSRPDRRTRHRTVADVSRNDRTGEGACVMRSGCSPRSA